MRNNQTSQAYILLAVLSTSLLTSFLVIDPSYSGAATGGVAGYTIPVSTPSGQPGPSSSNSLSSTELSGFREADPAVNPTSGFSVASTMVLYNGSLVPGNRPTLNGVAPVDVAFDSITEKIFVTNFESNSVSVISYPSNQVAAVVQVGLGPVGEAVVPPLGEVFVVNSLSHNLSVISATTNLVIATVMLPSYSDEVAYDSSTNELFVSANASDSVLVISPNNYSILASIPVGADPTNIMFDSARNELFVANTYSNNLSIISDSSLRVKGTVGGLNAPSILAYDAARGQVFVGDQGTDYLQVVNDTNQSTGPSIIVGTSPTGIAYDPIDDLIFVALSAQGAVRIVSGTNYTPLGYIRVGADPALITYSEAERVIVCPNEASDNVSIIAAATGTVVSSVRVGSSPSGIAFDSIDRSIFILDYRGMEADVVSTGTLHVLARVQLPGLPGGIVFDPSIDEIFVSIVDSNLVIVISGHTNSILSSVSVGFGPMGLAYDPLVHAVFVAGFGTGYIFKISDLNDSVVASIQLNFTPEQIAYDPARGSIYVTCLEGYILEISASSGVVTGSIFEGSHPSGIAVDSQDGRVFVSDEGSQPGPHGNLTVILDTANRIATRIPMGSSPVAPTYYPAVGDIIVPESGSDILTFCQAVAGNCAANVSVGLGPDAVAVDNQSGIVYAADGVQGAVSVVVPEKASFPVVFRESGLGAGTNWSIMLGAVTEFSSTTEIDFSEPNGTYSFTARTLPGWTSPHVAGSISIDGSGLSVLLQWTRIYYNVTFSESGLPSGTQWSVTVNGTSLTPASQSIVTEEPNGTYQFLVDPLLGYTVTPRTGSISVRGGPELEYVTFKIVDSPTVRGPTPPLVLGFPSLEGSFVVGVIISASVIAVLSWAYLSGRLTLRWGFERAETTQKSIPRKPGG